MDISPATYTRPLGVAAAAVLALGLVAAAPAAGAATAPSATVSNGTLTIYGSNGADDITVGIANDPTRFVVDFNGTDQFFDRATFSRLSAFLGHGDDTFSTSSANGAVTIPMVVDGGTGNDTITSGAANDQLQGGLGDDSILGGDGNDVIVGDNGDDTVDGQKGTDIEVLGNGHDVAVWLPGEGNDVVDGGSGNDTLVFDGNSGNEKFGLTAEGSHAIFTRDLGTIRMDLSNVDTLDLAAFAGTDTVAIGDLTGTDLTSADIDLGATPGGASDRVLDTVTVAGTDSADSVDVAADGSAVDVQGLHTSVRVTGADSRDQLQINAGAGDDDVSVSAAAQALITVAVDLGADQH